MLKSGVRARAGAIAGGVLVAQLLAMATTARAVDIRPGDIVATDQGFFSQGPGRVIRIDPVTGAQTLISEGGLLGADTLTTPTFDPLGRLFVVSSGRILRIDTQTGAQTAITPAGFDPRAVISSPSGDLLTIGGANGEARVDRINPDSGTRNSVFYSDSLGNAQDLALEADGNLIILTSDAQGIGRLIRVNALTGAPTTLATGNLLTIPTGLALDGHGHAFVTNLFDTVAQIDLASGAQSFVGTPGGMLHFPTDLDRDSSGQLVIGNSGGQIGALVGTVIRIDPVTGVQTPLASGGLLGSVGGIVVATVPAPGTGMVMGLAALVSVARRRRGSGVIACAVAASVASAGSALAVDIHPGDIIATDQGLFGGGPGRVIRIDPVTGAQTLITEGGLLGGSSTTTPTFDALGRLFVVSSGRILRIDTQTGAQAAITPVGFSPRAVISSPSGDLLTIGGMADEARVSRVNPDTGIQQSVFYSDSIGSAQDLALEPNGNIIILTRDSQGTGRLFRVNQATGTPTLLSSGNLLTQPTGLVLDGHGHAFVTNLLNTVAEVELATGMQSFVGTPGGLLHLPFDVDLSASGQLVVGNLGRQAGAVVGTVILIDPVTGVQTPLASGGLLGSVGGVVVATVPAPGTGMVMGLAALVSVARRRRGSGVIACAVAASVASAGSARAVDIRPGDIIATDRGLFGGGPGRVIRIDPVTGAQTLITEGGLLGGSSTTTPTFDALGRLFVVSSGTILRINTLTGAQAAVTPVGFSPRAVISSPSGDLLTIGGNGGEARVSRVNPDTGIQQSVFYSDSLGTAQDLALESNGDLIILTTDGVGIGRLIRVNSATGTPTLLSSGNLLTQPAGLVLDGHGHAFVTNLLNTVAEVELATGMQSFVGTPGGLLHLPSDVDLDASGRLVIGNFGGQAGAVVGTVILIDPVTGVQTPLASGGLLGSVGGVVVATVPGAGTGMVMGLAGLLVLARRRRVVRE